MNPRLEGRSALVTGGARGIGAAIVRRLAAEGASVAIGDVRRGEAEQVAAELGGHCSVYELDVTDARSWDALVSQLAPEPPSILVNNAGGRLGEERLHDASLQLWSDEISVNLTSAFLGMRATIPAMLERGGGAIVNITSISGLVGHWDSPGYQAAKGGLRALTLNAAATYAEAGIRVNAIAPGSIATARVEDNPRNRRFIEATPMRRSGQPEDIAHLAAYLVSDEAAYVTGAEFVVDGGYTAV
jgi:3alpha(or 20beta)-hydroxysteroid dehydrogenase